MSEKDTSLNGEENFEEMLNAYTGSMSESLSVGDRVKGSVISINGESIFIDTGTKVDGIAERDEFLNDEGELSLAEGDEVELFVVAASAQEIRLSKAVGGAGGAAMLQDAFDNKLPVEGKVTATRKGGFDVQVMKRRAFCPVSQIDTRFVENAEEYVGKTYQFAIIKFEQGGRNIVLSRRELLQQEQDAQRAEFVNAVNVGEIVDAQIVRLAQFGAFAELSAGVEGLIHISELSWTRVQEADEAVSVGDTVRVKILNIDTDKKGQLRISLSAKQVQEDPWLRVESELSIGEVREAKVVRLTKFGAFVELLPGVDGLVHVSEMSYVKRVHKPEDMVAAGDKVNVKIKGIDLGAKRISLSMRDAEGDPWADVDERFAVGSEVDGTMENRAEFGLFINLAPGITGLMPKSQIAKAEKPSDYENCKPGDAVSVTVIDFNIGERKITLAPKGVTAQEDTSWKQYKNSKPASPKPTEGNGGGFGSLGAALQDAMKRK